MGITRPTVSVIIATNRDGSLLDEALRSVAAQTVAPDQVIVVDDGSSTDGIQRVAARHLVEYVRQEPAGVSYARNHGAALAHGEWLAFLDDDDVWHPDRLRLQLDAIARQPDAVAVYSGGWYMEADGSHAGEGWPGLPATAAQMLRGETDIPRITTLLVRRTTLLSIGGFNVGYRLAEDNDLILRLLQVGEFAAVDQQLVGYRRHLWNATGGDPLVRHVASLNVLLGLIGSSRARGDSVMVRQLTANLRRFRRSVSIQTAREVGAGIRRGRWRSAAVNAGFGLRHMPIDFVRSMTSQMLRRVAR